MYSLLPRDSLLQFGPALDALAGGLLAKDHVDALSAKRTDLAIKVLVRAADPAIADFAHNFATASSLKVPYLLGLGGFAPVPDRLWALLGRK